MDENQVKQIVQSVLQQSQYKVGGVPYHTHNGIDSPKIATIGGSNSTPVNASGPGTNETVASGFTPKNIPIASASFANGITYGTTGGGNLGFTIVTAGQYLVIGQVFYGNPVVINKSYQSMVYVNGSEVFAAYNVPPAAGISVAVPAVKIISLSVGDYVELWAQTGSTGNETVSGGLSYLSLALV